jgi:site-specific recombinase XerD
MLITALNQSLVDISFSTFDDPNVKEKLAEYGQIFKKLPLNTQKAYEHDMKMFSIWVNNQKLISLTSDLAHNTELLKRYFSHLIDSHLARASIDRIKACICKFLSVLDWPNPFTVSAIFKDWYKVSLRDKPEFQKQAEALTIRDLNTINVHLSNEDPLDLRNKLILNIMFDGLLRASELCDIKCIHIDQKKATLFIPKSKTDQAGKGSYVPLSSVTLELIKLWKSKYLITNGYLLRSISPNKKVRSIGIKYRTVNDVFKKVTCFTDLENAHFTGHSARVGAAVTLAENGCDILEIQRSGRWRSSKMPAKYTEQANIHSTGIGRISKLLGR